MEFDLTAFTLAPSTEVFNKCRKKDLLLIADFFKIDVSKEATKQVIRKELLCELVKTGILPADSEEVLEPIVTPEEAVFADLAQISSPVHMQVVSPPVHGESINVESHSAFDIMKPHKTCTTI